MTPAQGYRLARDRFERSGIPDASWDAAALMSAVISLPALECRIETGTVLSPQEEARFLALVERRAQREPLQYVLGTTEFCGLTFHVDARVLIPRPETELVVTEALKRLPDSPGAQVLDLCCGSGCIGLALAEARPDCHVTLSDLSPDALAVAEKNAQNLNIPAECVLGSLFDSVPGRMFDLVLSNPPYIPSRDCETLQEEVMREPLLALDGGMDGLDCYRRILADAPGHMKPGASLIMEVGEGESEAVSGLAGAHGLLTECIVPDFRGIPRVVICRMP